jgi:hypothetical protein
LKDITGRDPNMAHEGVLKAPRAVRQWNMVMSPAGLGTKNDCAGEGQQPSTVNLVHN